MARATIELQDFLANPFGVLEQARKTGWLADLNPATGVLTYADVRELLSDPRLHANFTEFLRVFGITSGPFYEWMAMSPLNRTARITCVGERCCHAPSRRGVLNRSGRSCVRPRTS